MLADLPKRNIDAASQVAHAISTHQVSSEFDYYTAVDDLKPTDTAGADMIGTVEFNSACFYRYANIDISQLEKNLGGDRELVEATLRAFLLASRDAIPTGKQNSFAARNAPAFFFTVVRDRGAWSLANAFADPVRAGREAGLIEASIRALDAHWGELVSMYGAPAGAKLAVAALGQPALANLKPHQVSNFTALLDRTLEAARPVKGG
jgi:CRISPR system Cascade subunit CasC